MAAFFRLRRQCVFARQGAEEEQHLYTIYHHLLPDMQRLSNFLYHLRNYQMMVKVNNKINIDYLFEDSKLKLQIQYLR